MTKIKSKLNRRNIVYRIKKNMQRKISDNSAELETSHQSSESAYNMNDLKNCLLQNSCFSDLECSDYDNCQPTNGEHIDNPCQHPRIISENVIESGLNLNLKEFLKYFLNNHNIPRRSGNILLKYMHQNYDSSLPTDTRSLMKTPRKHNIISVHPGKYIHLSIRDYLESHSKVTTLPPSLLLTIFVDGLEISRSSKKGLWIILVKFHNLPHPISDRKPCILGLYCGKKRPLNSNDFLTPIVNDLKDARRGFLINGSLIKSSVYMYVMDSGARAFITGIRGHCSPHGCPKCFIIGKKIDGRMIFKPGTQAEPRTDEHFGVDPNHHRHPSILEEICNNMISDIPIDYMHCVLKGVTAKLIFLWINSRDFLTKEGLKEINRILNRMSKFQARDFPRKCRSFDEIGYFKASELRFFLLYAGPIVLKDILRTDCYINFIKLSAAIRILTDPDLIVDQLYIARDLINDFVLQFEEIYGLKHCVFNIHLLTHLSKDCEKYGVLDNFSSFEFESFLFSVKIMKRSHKNPVIEIFNRAREKLDNHFNSKYACSEHLEWCYSNFKSKNITLDNGEHSCWFMSKYFEIYRVSYFFCLNDNIYAHCYKVQNLEPLFTTPIYPFNSQHMNIYKSNNEYSVEDVVILSAYYRKIFHYSENDVNYFVAMNH